MTPAVSVLLPYRDAEATVEEAVRSVLDQEGVAVEVIAADDRSRDDGPARVGRIAARDPRLVPVRAEGEGIVAALATAQRAARAPLLGRMDADDVSLPGRLRAQVEWIEKDPFLGALGTLVEAFPEDAIGAGMRRYLAWQNGLRTPEEHARDLFVESPLCHPSVLLRREALEAAGGWREAPWPEDWDLWLRLDAAGWRLGKVPEVLLRWRLHPEKTTLRDPRCGADRFPEIRAFYLAPRLRAAGRAVAVWGAGPTGRRLARALGRRGVRAAAFVDIDPRKIGRTRQGAPVVEPSALRPGEVTVVVAVGVTGARDLVRAELRRRGFVEGEDFVCAA